MARKKRFDISNRLLYTIIAVGILAILGLGVYAFGTPNPVVFGHSFSEIAPPSGCSNNYFLQWTGSDWRCNNSLSGGNQTIPDITPPIIFFSEDFPTTIVGWALLEVKARDNVGIAGVQFYIDNVPIGNSIAIPPYSIAWNSSTVEDGSHTISATATDLSGNSASDSIVVEVLNNFICNYDGICDANEELPCIDCAEINESIDPFCNFNGYCQPQLGESYNSCPTDCPSYYGYVGSSYGGGSAGGGADSIGCFIPETQILTPSGNIAIGKLEVGDEVFSVNPESKNLVIEKVRDIYKVPAKNTLKVFLIDETILEVTQEHPFYDPINNIYKPIKKFYVGDKVLKLKGSAQELTITAIETVPSYEGKPVYNLHVSGEFNNYLANGVLVHNKMAYPGSGDSAYNPFSSGGGIGPSMYCFWIRTCSTTGTTETTCSPWTQTC